MKIRFRDISKNGINKKYILINENNYYYGGFNKNLIPLTVTIKNRSKKFKLFSQAKKAKEHIQKISGINFNILEV